MEQTEESGSDEYQKLRSFSDKTYFFFSKGREIYNVLYFQIYFREQKLIEATKKQEQNPLRHLISD